MRGLLFRIVIIIQTILLLTALSVPAWAASNEQPAEWVKDTLSPVPMIYPQHNEKYESVAAQAVVKYERTFDPSMFLKENIQNTASPETANRLSASLDRDKEFTLSVWTDIIGKPVETASQNEISSAMQLQQNKTISPYQEAVNQYQQLSQEPHYEP